MDYNYIKPFIDSTVSIIKEVTNADAEKSSTYMTKASQKDLDSGLYIDISGDISGRIIFNMTDDIINHFANKMLGDMPEDESANLLNDPEFVDSTIGELGNLITGRAITYLESSHYNCNIYPPVIFKDSEEKKIFNGTNSIIAVIDVNTDFGNFDICLVNKEELYNKNISIMLYNLDKSIVNKFIYTYIPRGFYVYSKDKLRDVNVILGRKHIDYLIGDFDKDSDENKKVLEQLRSSEVAKDILMGAYTTKFKDDSFKQNMKTYGIRYMIPKFGKNSDIIQNINAILVNNGMPEGERRKHIRVDISPKEKYVINFVLEDKSGKSLNINGLVIDLSLGTIFFKVSKKHIDYINLKQRLENAVLAIDTYRLRINGLVFYKKNNIVGIKLFKIPPHTSKSLCNIIFEKTNKDKQLRV